MLATEDTRKLKMDMKRASSRISDFLYALLKEEARIPKRSRLYLVPKERSLDLDTELDWKMLEYLGQSQTTVGN